MSEEEEQTVNDASEAASDSEAPAPTDLEAALAERDKFKEQLYRTAADLENFRKRARRDVEDAARRGREDTIREVLPIIDNLERAVGAAENATEVQAVIEGVQMVLRGFEEVSQRLGVTRVPGLGSKFDPNVHDAVQQLPSADFEAGTVMAEIMPGYVLGDKLIRAAMVVVAKPPVESAPEPEGDGDADEGVHFIEDDEEGAAS